MGLVFLRENDALDVNPLPGYDRDLTVNGSNWLWTVTAIFGLSFIVLYLHGWFFAPSGEKIFHYIYTIALLAGTISYFAMASNLGWATATQANEVDLGQPRQLFYAKYLYWLVSFPATTVALGLLSGISWATMLYWAAMSLIWVLSYIFSAFTATNYKWGFFVLGTTAYIAVAESLCWHGFKSADRVGTRRQFVCFMGWTELLFFLYPLAFGLSDGGNYIGVTPSFIFFGILDVLMVPAMAFVMVFFMRDWDFGKMNLYFTQYGRVQQGGAFPEKAPAATPAQQA